MADGVPEESHCVDPNGSRLACSRRRVVERQQRNADGTWSLSEHTSGVIVVLDHQVPLDELYDGVTLAGGA